MIQEVGFTVEVVKEMMRGWNSMLESDTVSACIKRDIIVVGGVLAVLVGGVLRGGEVLLMEASELIKRRLDGKDHHDHPHVVIPLMGHFKNKAGESNLLLTLASETQSGIEIHKWIERLIILLMRRKK